jgi:mannose-6-phosphate isomerase-like protein (cupin superfamily)
MAPATRGPALDLDAATAWLFDRAEPRLLDGAGRDGRVAVVERSAAEGAMPPLHSRDEDETYHVLEGEVTFFIGEETVSARVGDTVVARSGCVRTLRVDSPRARWLVLTHVRSLRRFEDFGRAIARPSGTAWPSAEELASLAALAQANGIRILGPPGLLPRNA